ncbi:MAG TPA: sulfotransferase [Bacteroidia bacterium]|nr:sulfotransferase [Bacteroidia bacterium]HNT80733.1 sulfotransferase [Bacteroidia bacterium]
MNKETQTPLPNFFIVGAAKCGTTSLYHYLKKHPEVYLSPIKEPNHFCSDIDPEEFSQQYKDIEKRKRLDLETYTQGDMKREVWGYFVQDWNHYTKLFKNVKNEKAVGEISNTYLFSNVAAKNIKEKIPNAKIIAMLRNPADRIYSHYMANLRDGKTFLSFADEMEDDYRKPKKGWYVSHAYYEMGMYYEQVKRFYDQFPKEQIRIYIYDDFKVEQENIVRDMLSFLEVDANVKLDFSERHNQAAVPKNRYFMYLISATGIKKNLFRIVPQTLKRKLKSTFFKSSEIPKMTAEERQKIINIYRDDVLKLQDLLKRDLSMWLK